MVGHRAVSETGFGFGFGASLGGKQALRTMEVITTKKVFIFSTLLLVKNYR
jgi:hypothetical protein